MGIRTFFQKKKKSLKEQKADSLERTTEKEGIDEIVEDTATQNNEMEELCEQVIDASYHGEDLKKEYQLVTDYLTDIQKIEEYLLVSPKELEEVTRRYLGLQNIRQE